MLVRTLFFRLILAAVVVGGVAGASGRGAAAGPRAVGGPSPDLRVPSKGTDTHEFTFRKGVKVTINVRGDGDTDLDLYVYDLNDKLIAKDDDLTDNCVVAFTPEETAKYRVKVVNLGSVYNEYSITVK